MPLIERHGSAAKVAEDRFVPIDDEAPLPGEGAVVVSLGRFEADREALLAREGDLGVRLRPDESPKALADDLDRIALVALEFPVFSDGRAFSSARLLRERLGYAGEIRAVGDVLCEQLPFMLRSGFDTFDMASADALAEAEAVFGEVRIVYQPTGDGRATAIDQRRGDADAGRS